MFNFGPGKLLVMDGGKARPNCLVVRCMDPSVVKTAKKHIIQRIMANL